MPKISEEQREARRQEILEAAQRCFAEHGYERATECATDRSRRSSRSSPSSRNGFAFARIAGATLPDLDQLMQLAETGVEPR